VNIFCEVQYRLLPPLQHSVSCTHYGMIKRSCNQIAIAMYGKDLAVVLNEHYILWSTIQVALLFAALRLFSTF
jgi:hypothetical protein